MKNTSPEFQAMVLAAGFGTRLWPLTTTLAKPAVPFLGKGLVAHGVDLLLSHKVTNICVNTHYQAESVEKCLEERPVSFSYEDEILGTAGAIRQAIDLGHLSPDSDIMVFNGKLYSDANIEEIFRFHRERAAAVTMVLRPNPSREAFREILCEDGRVVGFGEGRQPKGDNPLLFTGIHVLSPKVIAAIPVGNSDTIRDIYPTFIQSKQVHAFVDTGEFWWEFSTLQRYVDLHIEAQAKGLTERNTVAHSAKVASGAALKNCIIWANAEIPDDCELTEVIVGEDVIVPSGTRLNRHAIVHKSQISTLERGYIQGEYVFVPLA